eukprot:6614927-Prymnesium_polylepis.1
MQAVDAAGRVARECRALCRRLGADDPRLPTALELLLRRELAADALRELLGSTRLVAASSSAVAGGNEQPQRRTRARRR